MEEKKEGRPEIRHEEQFSMPGWKNPYVVYVVLTTLLFLFLLVMGYLAWTNDWLPKR